MSDSKENEVKLLRTPLSRLALIIKYLRRIIATTLAEVERLKLQCLVTKELTDAQHKKILRIEELLSSNNLEIKSKDLKIRTMDVQLRTDSLTGLGNKFKFEEEWKNLEGDSPNEMVGLILVDIDHFKKINDENGHKFGDRVLSEFGRILPMPFRSSDIVCRIGGEEFGIIVRQRNGKEKTEKSETKFIEELWKLSNRAREFIANHNWKERGLVDVTVSMGVSKTILGLLFEKADDALYRAKDEGRNRVKPDTVITKILQESENEKE